MYNIYKNKKRLKISLTTGEFEKSINKIIFKINSEILNNGYVDVLIEKFIITFDNIPGIYFLWVQNINEINGIINIFVSNKASAQSEIQLPSSKKLNLRD